MDNKAIAAIIFIAAILLINAAMFGMVRGIMRPNGKKSPLELLGQALNPRRKEDPADELHRRIADLKPDSKDE